MLDNYTIEIQQYLATKNVASVLSQLPLATKTIEIMINWAAKAQRSHQTSLFFSGDG